MKTEIDMIRLGAYVDGELSETDRAEVEARLDHSVEDRLSVAQMREMDLRLALAFREPIDAPIPEALVACVQGGARGFAMPGWRAIVGMGLAASIAIAIGAVIGGQLSGPGQPVIIVGSVASDGALSSLLETGATGESLGPDREGVTLMSTFLDGAGRPCREIENIDTGGFNLTRAIACRNGDAWSVEFTAAQSLLTAGEREDYVAASGAGADLLGSALDVLDAGPVLGPSEVSDLISRKWSVE